MNPENQIDAIILAAHKLLETMNYDDDSNLMWQAHKELEVKLFQCERARLLLISVTKESE